MAVVGLTIVVAGSVAAAVVPNGAGTATATTDSGPTTSATTAPLPTLPPRPFPYGTSPCPARDGSSPRRLHFPDSPADCLDEAEHYVARLTTTAGVIEISLHDEETPGTVNSFVFLSRWHYYDGIELFPPDLALDVIQTGAPHTQNSKDPGPGFALPDEPEMPATATGYLRGPYTYPIGAVAMARAKGPDTANAQFFFVAGPQAAKLNAKGSYVVFGHVTRGLDILQHELETATRASGNPGGGPPVEITSTTITSIPDPHDTTVGPPSRRQPPGHVS